MKNLLKPPAKRIRINIRIKAAAAAATDVDTYKTMFGAGVTTF